MPGRIFLFAIPLLVSCACPPKGDNVEADIRAYAYQNRPRSLPVNASVAPFTTGLGGAAIASSDIPWRVPATCRLDYRTWLAGRSEPVADQEAFFREGHCPAGPKDAVVAVAISGGGNKSAVYSGEVLFELQRYGLADDIDVVSSVSGGSFTALLYALSCDEGTGCVDLDGWQRPRWHYRDIRKWLETNYFWDLVAHRLRPDNLPKEMLQHHGSDDDLAVVVARDLLRQNRDDLTFKDLNPARPNLILNSTNVTQGRTELDLNAPIPPEFQRPLTDDDALHFAFTQQYFWRLLSDLNVYPVKEALVASAAFPLIIDRPSLRQYRLDDLAAFRTGTVPDTVPKYVALFDGGVQDNFGILELQWFLQCQLNRPNGLTSSGVEFYHRECAAPRRARSKPGAALVFGINSSLLRSEGSMYDKPRERGPDTYMLPVRFGGALQSVNMIMNASGEQRRQQLRRLMHDANPPSAPPGYAPDVSENPELRQGPFQYVDIDLEAAQVLYCNPGRVRRDGGYDGGDPDPRLLNAATGGSDKSRCEALRGVLRWNDEGPEGRNLKLPTVDRDFCSTKDDCRELEPLIGERKFMVRYDENGKPDLDHADLAKIFFDPENRDTPRLLSNRLLFDAVQSVPTDFKLPERYAWLLRYTARWAVAHRIWRLCHDNGPLLTALGPGKYQRVCKDKLPPRELDDHVGSAAFKAAFKQARF